jgi:hypothetical protein
MHVVLIVSPGTAEDLQIYAVKNLDHTLLIWWLDNI